ncbi:MAG: glycogen synthase GlgA [Candidatus Bipolaricaulota bacterium]|nr:glycogen synthase GlgA [Candidatus Bipolaricaulota bacterium]MDW8127211.1 glycogen synthase GlgA [Candidatus Bipolaricaulota bacterium]
MRVVFVAAEAAPFAKAGGLGDVIGSLPKALSQLGIDVTVFIPRYRGVPSSLPKLGTLRINGGNEIKEVSILQGFLPRSRVPVHFVDFPPYYERAGIYGEGDRDYPDNLTRFAFLCQVAAVASAEFGRLPEIFHVHDWHTALLPLYLRYYGLEAKTVLTIHNLAFQGWFPREAWASLGLSEDLLALAGQGEWRCALRAGIVSAEALTTVSPTYAQEILSDGLGLDEVLRARAADLVGILNGIDTEEWDPEKDEHLWAPYSHHDLRGKALNRRKLCAELGLRGDGPILGMVGRLTEQKGLDLLVAGLDRVMALGVNLVILGTGEARYGEFLRQAEKRWPQRLRALLEFSETWAHRVIAGADFLLMPSRFEPCGLTQLYALRYGAIPIVRAVGGLRDTVADIEDGGNGLVFEDYTAEAMIETIARAVRLWHEAREKVLAIRRRGMQGDYSWKTTAQKYLAVYERVLSR